MKAWDAYLLCLAVSAGCLLPPGAAGLIIYRLGNPDISPPPEAQSEGVSQERLSWEEAPQGADGVWEALTLDNRRLFPIGQGRRGKQAQRAHRGSLLTSTQQAQPSREAVETIKKGMYPYG